MITRIVELFHEENVVNRQVCCRHGTEDPRGGAGEHAEFVDLARVTNERKEKSRRTDHSGSSFDSFLEEEELREEVEAVAFKRVLACQLEQAIQEQPQDRFFATASGAGPCTPSKIILRGR